jgi:hypothetical protein
MSHILNFEDFLNEGAKFNPKPFNQVKPGNTAHVLGHDGAWEVLATGYGRDYESKLKKYDTYRTISVMKKNPGNYGMEKSDFDELELIAVKHGDMINVYTYDDGGSWVNK